MADLALALTMAVWGSTFAVLRFFFTGGDGMQAASPLVVLALRMGLASLLLGIFMIAQRLFGAKRPAPLPGATRALLRDGFFVGALLGIGFLLQTEGLLRTSASRSGFLTGLLVAFVPLFELIIFRKKPAPPALVALAIAFAGMAILSGPLDGNGPGTYLGDLLTVGCALVFAGHILALGRAAPKHPLLPLLLCQLVAVGVLAAIVGPFVEETHLPHDPKLALAVVYLSLFATLLAFGVQTWAQRHVTPLRIALLSALEPAFAAGFAALLLGERLRAREFFGGALIISGVVIGEAGAAMRSRRIEGRSKPAESALE